MRGLKMAVILVNILLLSILTTSCWNYNEVNEKAIVAGVAVDPGETEKYLVTVEIVNPISEGTEAKMKSVVVGMEGESLFDAVRNLIAKIGKKLYWSHTQVMIIDQDLARNGIRPILDFINRDPEIRADIYLLVSKEETAKDIFKEDGEINQIRSFQFGNIMRAGQDLSKIFPTELWHYLTFLYYDGAEPVIPAVEFCTGGNGTKSIKILSSGIFNGDKLVGWIDATHNKYLLWIWNVYISGVIAIKDVTNTPVDVTIEVLTSSTRVKPVITDIGLEMNIDLEITGAIAEINGELDVISGEKRKEFEKETEKYIVNGMKEFILDIQQNYSTDIFDFGLTVKRHLPQVWKEVGTHWDEVFSTLPVNIKVDVVLERSGNRLRPIDRSE